MIKKSSLQIQYKELFLGGLIVFHHESSEDICIQQSHKRGGECEGRKCWLGNGDEETNHSGSGKAGNNHLANGNPIIVVRDYHPNIEQSDPTEQATRGEERFGFCLTDKGHCYRKEAKVTGLITP